MCCIQLSGKKNCFLTLGARTLPISACGITVAANIWQINEKRIVAIARVVHNLDLIQLLSHSASMTLSTLFCFCCNHFGVLKFFAYDIFMHLRAILNPKLNEDGMNQTKRTNGEKETERVK